MFLTLLADLLSAIGVIFLVGVLIVTVLTILFIVALGIAFIVTGIKVMFGKDK